MSPRTKSAAWAAVPVVGVLLALAPATFGWRTLSRRDTEQLYEPVRTLVVEALREWRLPLWNAYEAGGKPLFAEGVHSVLHPVSVVGAWVAPRSVDFQILSYLSLAALGACLMSRVLGASTWGSAGAGLAYALSGYTASMTGNLVFLAGLSTLPWVLAAARAAGDGGRWGMVWTGLATACAFLTGDAQVAGLGLVLGAALAADAGGRRGLARALAGMGAGLLLAGVQIAATAELLPQTLRGKGLVHWEKDRWSLAPARLLEWLVPGIVRGPLAAVPLGPGGKLIDMPFAESVYLGVPLVVAAGLGLTARSGGAGRRTALLLGGAAAVLLWLAMGQHLGARQALDWVPVWSRFRYAEKLMAPLSLVLVALAALGVDAFGARGLPRGARRAIAGVAVAAGAGLVLLLAARAGADALAARLHPLEGPFLLANFIAGLPHLLAASAALLAVDRFAGARRGPALALLVPLAAAVALPAGVHFGAPELRAFVTPLRLESDGPPRIVHPSAHLVNLAGDYVEEEAARQALLLYPPVNVAHRVDILELYGPFEPQRFGSLLKSCGDDWARAFRRFGATHVVFGVPYVPADTAAVTRATEGARLVQQDDALRYRAWAVPHRPWSFFADRTIALADADPARALRIVSGLVAREDDGTVVVETAASPSASPGRVLGVERGAEVVRVEAEAEGPALLVVQDAFWPGWRATVDGEPVEILAADYLVRAVRWPAGRHRLEMRYEPPSLRVGLALSALGALALGLLAVLARLASPAARGASEPQGAGDR
jgi:hypothetical protein